MASALDNIFGAQPQAGGPLAPKLAPPPRSSQPLAYGAALQPPAVSMKAPANADSLI